MSDPFSADKLVLPYGDSHQQLYGTPVGASDGCGTVVVDEGYWQKQLAERDKTIRSLRSALDDLHQKATRVHNIGAATGPQWNHLTASLLSAHWTLQKFPPLQDVEGESKP